MPYRHAHLWLTALVPLIGLAFWPGYFGVLRGARFAQHAHGITSTAWIVLLIVQAWSIRARRLALHRGAGIALFVVVPLFVAGGLIGIRDMAVLWTTAADPFDATYGSRLGLDDLLAIATLLLMVRAALVHRRRIALHAGFMLATALLVLPPVLARLIPALPGFAAVMAATGQPPFEIAFHAAQLVSAALALGIAAARGRDRAPFLIAAGLAAAHSLLFVTVARSAAWTNAFAAMPALLPASLALGGIVVAGLLLASGWRGPWPRRGPAAQPVRSVTP